MPRKATGQLILRETGYFGRYWANQDGVRVRVSVALETFNAALAESKLARLVAAAARPERVGEETFGDVLGRVHASIIDSQVDNARQQGADADHLARIRMYGKDALTRLEQYAAPVIGDMPLSTIGPTDICSALRFCREKKGKSHQTMLHLKKHLQDVFSELRRDQLVTKNPVRDIDPDDLPKPPPKNMRRKPRAVLTDGELALYLCHSSKLHHQAIRERQVMSVIARIAGGLRTGDLHGLTWSDLDATDGRFATVFVPREKTGEPDWFVCPESLRPFLVFWWELNGCPTEGLVFPASRGERQGERKIKVSHARALKRDVQAAFEAARKAGIEAPAPRSERWLQLFTVTPRTLPLDFHGWRRVFVQQTRRAKRELDQHSMPLSGHRSSAVHGVYAQGISNEVKTIPADSLPSGIEAIVPQWYEWWKGADRVGYERAARKRQTLALGGSEPSSDADDARLSARNDSLAISPALCHAGGRGFESRPPRHLARVANNGPR
ncbi:MAG: Phage integrase family [Pseudomonadota bacterium]